MPLVNVEAQTHDVKLTTPLPGTILRELFKWRGTVLPAVALTTILMSGMAAMVQYASEQHGVDFTMVGPYHDTHLQISIFLPHYRANDPAVS